MVKSKKVISIILVAVLILFISVVAIVQRYTISFINHTTGEHALFDFKASSSIGFTKEDIDEISAIDGVRSCEGSNSCDVAMTKENGRVFYMEINSMTSEINSLKLVSGRLPETASECVVDAHAFYEEQIGESLTIANLSSEEDRSTFVDDKFTIVGLVISPYYVLNERGMNDEGTEAINAFAFVDNSAFFFDVYSDVFIKLDDDYSFFDDNYEQMVLDNSDRLSEVISNIVIERYRGELTLAKQEEEATKDNDNKSAGEDDSKKNAGTVLSGRENKLSKAAGNIEYYTAHKAELETLMAALSAEISSMDEAAKTDPTITSSSTYTYKNAQYQNALTEYNNLMTTLEVANKEIEDYKLQVEASKQQLESTDVEAEPAPEEESQDTDENIPVISLIDRNAIPGYSVANMDRGLFKKISYSFDNLDYIFSMK